VPLKRLCDEHRLSYGGLILTSPAPSSEHGVAMRTKLSRRMLLAGAAGLSAISAVSTRTHGEPQTVNTPLNVDRFIEDVKRARLETDSHKAVEEILGRVVSNPGSVLRGIGEPAEAGIHTIYRSADLTILNVVWAPLMVLLPHNHNMWAIIGIYTGREDNIIWQRRGDVIEASGAASLSQREVFGLPSDAIHSVTNPIGRLTGAIHIYGGDFFQPGRSEWDPEQLRERPFDLEAARRTFQEANERFKPIR
jgi:predicted metal-dependent enzyme (double-stranded beta helix superfamily)